MPGTSSAIPERLAQLASLGAEAAESLGRESGRLGDALVAWVRSDSTGVSSASVLGLAAELGAIAALAHVWADGVGDVGAAFARVGVGSLSPPTLESVVRAPDAAIAAVLDLPGGRARTVEELQAMAPAEVLAWFRRLQALPGFDEPDFRAVEGLLAAADAGIRAQGSGSIFADPAFDRADAVVLSTMQDGWLAAHGVPAGGSTSPATAAAIEAWAGWFAAGVDRPEVERDRTWARAEEASVWAAEDDLRTAGAGFGPGMLALVPFTHTFRYAVANGREEELVESMLDTVDPGPLQDRAGDLLGEAARSGTEAALDRWPWLLGPVVDVGLVPDRLRGLAPAAVGAAVDGAVDLLPVDALLDDPWFRGFVDGGLDPLAEVLVDPSATPPPELAVVLDAIIGEAAPMPDPPGAYYLARLADLGYLPGLGDVRPFPGAVPDLPVA